MDTNGGHLNMEESNVFQAMGRDPTSSREAILSGSRNNDLHADFNNIHVQNILIS